jgi:hypothetical protein
MLQQLERKLWRGAKTWCLEATAGYNNAPQDEGASKGGVATLLVPKWAQLVTDQGLVLQNQVHWFIIRGIPGGDTGFLNLYASNNTSDRCLLWKKLILSLPDFCRWVVVGDFNMVEERTDKTN